MKRQKQEEEIVETEIVVTTTTTEEEEDKQEGNLKKIKLTNEKVEENVEEQTKNKILSVFETLDICTSFTTLTEFENTFTDIATFLFNQTELTIVKNNELHTYRLAELEFYCTVPKIHPDPFSHCHPIQENKGEWYFHQSLAKINDNNYKGGNYKGLDISIGGGKVYRAGILIRSLIRLKDNELIDGPSKCVDELIGHFNCKNIHDFVKKYYKGKKHFNALQTENNVMYLNALEKPYSQTLKKGDPYEGKIIQSGRVGLTLKQNENIKDRIKYIFKPYRYCLCGDKIKKGKHLMSIVLYKQLKEKMDDENKIIKEVEKRLATSGLTKYFKSYREKEEEDAFSDEESINEDKVQAYRKKDFNTTDIYELGGILSKIY
ncbi:hypothetical protein ABK040_006347 [Willaertia magna]